MYQMVISICDLSSGPWKAYFSHFWENNQEWESMYLAAEVFGHHSLKKDTSP